jgi:hypothetical protein
MSYEYDYDQIWLMVRTPRTFNAYYVDRINQDVDTILTVDHLELAEGGFLAGVQANDEFNRAIVLWVEPDGMVHQPLIDYFSAEVYIDSEAGEITVVNNTYDSDQFEITTYKWNGESQELDGRKANFDFGETQDVAQRLVFQEHNYLQAIVYINEILVQAPPEPKFISSCISNECNYFPDWYRPYMFYLLGLSYDMAGRKSLARDVYFNLWQDYPNDMFGMAALHRLVAVSK